MLLSLIRAHVIPLLDATPEKRLCYYVRQDLISTLS